MTLTRQVGHVLDFALDDLLGDLERQVDDLALGGAEEDGVVLVDVAGQRHQALHGIGHRLFGGGQALRLALLEANVVALDARRFFERGVVGRWRRRAASPRSRMSSSPSGVDAAWWARPARTGF